MRKRNDPPKPPEVSSRTFARTAHGTARDGGKMLVVETPPVDELPVGIAAPERPVADRDEQGRLLPGAGTRSLASMAGKAKAEARQLARLLGLWTPDESDAYHPYHRLAREWRDDHMRTLAETVGGGRVGPGPASIVSSAAIQLGASRYLSDMGAKDGDVKMLMAGARLADQSRQSLLSAHALCALEAKARAASNPVAFPWMNYGSNDGEGDGTNTTAEGEPPNDGDGRSISRLNKTVVQ